METHAIPVALDSLKAFCNIAPIGISFIDDEGTILFANNTELKLLGYAACEYLDHNIATFHEDKSSLSFIAESLQRHKPFINHEARLRCKDGSCKDVLISLVEKSVKNPLNSAIFYTRDITFLKKSERYLKFLNKASEELASMHDSTEALDKITKLIVPEFADWVVINELRSDGLAYLLKMAHADPNKVVWAEKYRTDHPIDLQDTQVGSVGWAMRTGQSLLVPQITEEIINRGSSDAEQRELLQELNIQSVMIIPMQVKGRITGVVSFMSCNPLNVYSEQEFSFAKDLVNHIALTLENARLYSEVKLDIQERIDAAKRKDEFIGIASHELKTPITSLKAYTQVLQMGVDDISKEELSTMLNKIHKQTDKLHKLVVDLLDISKIDQGEMVFEFEEFDFNELVKEVAEEMQHTAFTHEIELQLNPCEKIKGDKNRLGQVITNFISNSIKYSPDEKKIIITTECSEHIVKLAVTDFGMGIPREQHGEIFKRFFRVNRKNGHSFPGLGLGLYICAEIIRRHGGKIYFESDEEKGSTFCFEISSETT